MEEHKPERIIDSIEYLPNFVGWADGGVPVLRINGIDTEMPELRESEEE